MQPTQHTTATETSDAQTPNTEAAANACGIAFIRALNVLRESADKLERLLGLKE